MKKRYLTLKKLQEKVSQLFFVALGFLNNILKVIQKSTTRKVFFSRWPFIRFKKNDFVRLDCTAL